MSTPPLSWPALRQLAWAGMGALPAADLDAHTLLLAADARVLAWQPLPGKLNTPPPAPVETQPAVDSTGDCLLRQCLRPGHGQALGSYCAGVAARGYRVPTNLVTAVLVDRAASKLGPDEHLAQVLGERGRWLAQLNPAWQHLLSQPNEQSWATDSYWQRRQFLNAYRRAAPDQAHAFLVAHLAQVPAGEQAGLLPELAQHLGPADEPMLMPYLRSPDFSVRQMAGSLLARIPGSWLAEQLWAYARPLLSLRTAADGQVALHITLPQHWPAAWQAVGIERSHYGGEENPLGWVEQLLALVPPQRWTEQWQLTPRQVVQLAAPLDVGPTLFKAWAAAASLHKHQEWAIALVEAELSGFPLPGPSDYEQAYSPVQVLPPPAAEALLAYVPAAARLRDKAAPWQRVLLVVDWPWPKAILERVLQLLADSLQERSHENFRIIRQLLIRGLVQATAPAHYELLKKRLSEFRQARTHHHSLVKQALYLVRLRRQVTQWLAALPPAQ